MGVDLVIYRARIGQWSRSHSFHSVYNKKATVDYISWLSLISVVSCGVCIMLVASLASVHCRFGVTSCLIKSFETSDQRSIFISIEQSLIMGGIELNPGPLDAPSTSTFTSTAVESEKKVFHYIAQNLPDRSWRRLGIILELEWDFLEDVELYCKFQNKSKEEKILKVLEKWRNEKEPQGDDFVGLLQIALRRIKHEDIAKNIPAQAIISSSEKRDGNDIQNSAQFLKISSNSNENKEKTQSFDNQTQPVNMDKDHNLASQGAVEHTPRTSDETVAGDFNAQFNPEKDSCSDGQCEEVSKMIGRNDLKSLARNLSIPDNKVQEIKTFCMVNRYGDQEMVFNILKVWRQKEGIRATQKQLIETLCRLNRRDIVSKVFAGHENLQKEKAGVIDPLIKPLREISEQITPSECRPLARELRLTEQEVEHIENDQRMGGHGPFEIPYQILKAWCQREGSRATMDVIANALIKIRTIGRENLQGEKTALIDPLIKKPSPVERRAPITDDIIAGIQAMQKDYFKDIQLPRCLWLEEKNMTLEELFVELTMKKKDKKGREIRTPIVLEEMFQIEEEKKDLGLRILIEGPPGYGKTTLLLKILSDWSREKVYVSRSFRLVFIILLRSFEDNLHTHLHQQCFKKFISKEDASQAIQSIEGQVLLLLDGWDEATEQTKLKLTPLLQRCDYPHMTVVITSRTGFYHWPRVKDVLNTSGCGGYEHQKGWSKRIQVKGISHEKREEFLQKYLKKNATDLHRKIDKLPIHFNNFYECPLFLLLLGILIEEEKTENISTKTQLYKAIFNFIINRNLVKSEKLTEDEEVDIFDANNTSSMSRNVIIDFGHLCLDKLKEHSISFKDSEILINKINVYEFGFLTKMVSFIQRKEKTEYEPIHRNFLEFLAAFYLSTLDKTDLASQVKDLFKMGLTPTKDQLVYHFLCGLIDSEASKLFHSLLPFKDLIRLLDIKNDFRCTLQPLLDEVINSNEQIIKSLIPFVPTYLIDSNEDGEEDLPSTEFLKKWVGPVVNLSREIQVIKEFRFNKNDLNKITLLSNCITPFRVNKMIVHAKDITSLASIEGNFNCRKLVIEYSCENLSETLATMLQKILPFCCSERLYLEIYYSQQEKVEPWTQMFIQFCKELMKGEFCNLNIHHLSILRIKDLDYFPSIISSIKDLIKAKKVTFGIKFSFENYNIYKMHKFVFGDIVRFIVNSHIKSFSFHAEKVTEVIAVNSKRREPWKYLELKGFLQPHVTYAINTISVTHLNCIDIETLKKDTLSHLLGTCKNIKKLSCHDIESIQVEILTDWQGFLTIETLELKKVIFEDKFSSLVSNFKNLKKLKINDLRLPSEYCKQISQSIGEVLLKTLYSLPHLNTLFIHSDDGRILYEALEGFSRLTVQEKRKICLQELILNSARVNPFPMNEIIEEYKWLTRNKRILETFKNIQQQQYKEEVSFTMSTWLEGDVPLDQLVIHLESKDVTTEGKEAQSQSIRTEQLFDKEPRCIFVESSSRIVSNVFCCKIVRDWATGKKYVGNRFSLLFHFNEKHFRKEASIEEMLIEKFPGKDTTSHEVIIACITKYQHRILLILQGYDEMSEKTKREVEPLLRRRLFPKLHLLITCSETNPISRQQQLKPNEYDENIKSCFDRRVHVKMIDGPLNKDWLDMGPRLKDTIDSVDENKTTTIFDCCPLLLPSLHLMIKTIKEKRVQRRTSMYKDYFNHILKKLSNTKREVDIFALINHNSILSPDEYVQTLSRFGKYALQKMIKKESVAMDENELEINCGDKSILRLGFLVKTGNLYKPIDESFVQFTAAFSTFNVLRESGEGTFKSEIQMREGLRPTTDDSLFFPFLAGLLNDKAGLLFEALLPVFDSFHLANVTFANIFIEILDIHPFVDSIRNLLTLFFPPFYSAPRTFASIDKEFCSSPIHSLLFNSALESNAIQTLGWGPSVSIPLKENGRINHLLLYLYGNFNSHNQLNEANSFNSQTLSLRFHWSFKVERWSDVVRFIDSVKRNKICFEFQGGYNASISSLLLCLHNELIEGRWREETVDRVDITIDIKYDPKCFRHLVDLVRSKKIKGGIRVQIEYRSERNKELKAVMKSDLETLFDSILQSKTISDIQIANNNSIVSPVLDFSRSPGEKNVTFKSVYLHGYLTALKGNKRATLSIEETIATCWGDEKKNYQFIQNIQGIKWLWCFMNCFDSLVEKAWPGLKELEELTLSFNKDSLRVNPAISNLIQLRVLTLDFFKIKHISRGSDLSFFGFLSSLSLRIFQLILIPHDISSFDWLVDCVFEGLNGKKEKSKSNATPPLDELLVYFRWISFIPFDWNDLKGSRGIKGIQKMLQMHLLRQFSWVDRQSNLPRDLPRSLFSLEDEFTIKLEVDGSDPVHSRHSQYEYRWMINVSNKCCITYKTD